MCYIYITSIPYDTVRFAYPSVYTMIYVPYLYRYVYVCMYMVFGYFSDISMEKGLVVKEFSQTEKKIVET